MESIEKPQRVVEVDALRGWIMILMALDHVRHFFHVDANVFRPEDLTRTTAALFFTRWVTHFCAPVFVFTAGMAVYFLRQRGQTPGQVARYLWTRGVWLVLLEVTLMRVVIFLFGAAPVVVLEVIWVLGVSMILLAGLIFLPLRVLAGLSVAVVALHNGLDAVQAGGWWNLLHRQGPVVVGPVVLVASYPLVPWFAVMAGGYCLAHAYGMEGEVRRRLFTRLGWAMTLGFFALRAANVYGDLAPWDGSSALSFFNVTKYPPSLAFLLMTLGPAIALLPRLARAPEFVLVYGRVPLFYFFGHLFLGQALAKLAVWWQLGRTDLAFSWTFSMLSAERPAEYGFSLGVVYGIWLGVVAAMYPLCRWFGDLKRRRGAEWWWLRYL